MNFYMQELVRSTAIRGFPNAEINGPIPCTFQIVGVCNYNWATCVWCHLQLEAHGSTAGKCSDLSGAVGCSKCHDLIDMRDERWQDHLEHFEFYKRRAIDRSLHMLWQHGILQIKGGGKEFNSEDGYQQLIGDE